MRFVKSGIHHLPFPRFLALLCIAKLPNRVDFEFPPWNIKHARENTGGLSLDLSQKAEKRLGVYLHANPVGTLAVRGTVYRALGLRA